MSLLDYMKSEYDECEDKFWAWTKTFDVIESEIMDQGRWDLQIRDIVTHEDYPNEYVEVIYSEGATEYQDDTDLCPNFRRVFPKMVSVTKYVGESEL